MQLDLAQLDRRIAQTETLLTLARECEFTEIAASIERDVRQFLPHVAVLACLAAADDLTAITARYRRLRALLS